MNTETAEPQAKAAHTYEAHNTQGVRGWAVSVPHPSGDGSYYAAKAQGLTEEEARLWAAAPDLLKALRRIVDGDDRIATTMPTEWIDAARAAIAKAQP